ncbi:3-keto-disaccharide hydrolase [Pleomorphovibrio marinus]|uniref:3-keto-disaccharide hydrolase n=1 Tax=Pleomorphovibrio marinus TaxID=2164132 RepID=UPI000E0C6448|nr:DUF1080 domain-containing protein [Pleomorphovibrio marinus]
MQSAKFIYTPFLLIWIMACSPNESKEDRAGEKSIETNELALNTLTDTEKAQDWELLFDGVSTQGWHSYLGDETTWQVAGGILYTEGGNGDIVTDAEFEDFELLVDWKIQDQGNSGVFYHVIEAPEYPRIHHTGPEFQLIDDENYPQELLDTQKTGAISDLKAPDVLASNSPGEWNHTRIVVQEGQVEHWLNGEKVVEAEMGSPEWEELVANSKFAEFDYAKVRKGRIGLQDHGDPVAFRNIKIRVL